MVATWKKDMVKTLSKKLKDASTVGVVKIEGVPSRQLQVMKKTLKGKAELRVVKRNVLKHAFEKSELSALNDHLDGSVGIITSSLNPFQLEKAIYGCRRKAPAKPGMTAPFDIVAPKGNTGLPAGPVIGDLQNAGIKAKIQGGKIMIQENSVVVKAGEKVTDAKSVALMRLKIEPFEIGLDLKAAWEKGIVYTSDVLHITEADTIARIQSAHLKAFNLAYNAGIFTTETVPLLLQEAFCNARNLAINAEIINKDSVGVFLSRADAQAKALKSVLPEELKPAEGQ